MNRLFSAKFVIAAGLAAAALGTATVAEARPSVYFSVGLQSEPAWFEPGPAYVQPRPVYVQPRPVYVQPATVYARPPVFVTPGEVFERPRWSGYDGRFEWARERAWRRAEWRRHPGHDEFRGGDREGDRGGRVHHYGD